MPPKKQGRSRSRSKRATGVKVNAVNSSILSEEQGGRSRSRSKRATGVKANAVNTSILSEEHPMTVKKGKYFNVAGIHRIDATIKNGPVFEMADRALTPQKDRKRSRARSHSPSPFRHLNGRSLHRTNTIEEQEDENVRAILSEFERMGNRGFDWTPFTPSNPRVLRGTPDSKFYSELKHQQAKNPDMMTPVKRNTASPMLSRGRSRRTTTTTESSAGGSRTRSSTWSPRNRYGRQSSPDQRSKSPLFMDSLKSPVSPNSPVGFSPMVDNSDVKISFKGLSSVWKAVSPLPQKANTGTPENVKSETLPNAKRRGNVHFKSPQQTISKLFEYVEDCSDDNGKAKSLKQEKANQNSKFRMGNFSSRLAKLMGRTSLGKAYENVYKKSRYSNIFHDFIERRTKAQTDAKAKKTNNTAIIVLISAIILNTLPSISSIVLSLFIVCYLFEPTI